MGDCFSEDLKAIFLAGVGAAAITAEKGKALVEELVQKGRLTVEQGRVLNEELRHRVRTEDQKNETKAPYNAGDVLRSVDHMSKEDLAALKAKLAAMETAEEADESRTKD